MARLHSSPWTLEDSYRFIANYSRRISPKTRLLDHGNRNRRKHFHDYFVTHLPSSSLHPDSRSPTGPHHKLPRSASTPHTPGRGPSPAAAPPMIGVSRETTVVRIPLKSAKHHFGVSVARGTRPYNEDSYQAGVIELPAFAKRPPVSLTKDAKGSKERGEASGAESASGDPQVFYFGVFDGHGGAECSGFLRERLHEYIEETGKQFELQSSLEKKARNIEGEISGLRVDDADSAMARAGQESLAAIETTAASDDASIDPPANEKPYPGDPPLVQEANRQTIKALERSLVNDWRDLVGGYFRRFKPAYFSLFHGYQMLAEQSEPMIAEGKESSRGAAIEEVMTYAFLKADLDFVSAQASKKDDTQSERPLNENDILGEPSQARSHIGGPQRFKGGSTCSVALVSTPTPTPFWHPATPSSMLVAHVGDTRIILCNTATGRGVPLTTDHHPSSPVEANRLRRYAATFVTDSFGEERMSGLANTRAFGDIQSKRIGISAEPEIKRVEIGPAEYSFLVLVSDGVSGTLSDQEIVDIIKESKTPEQGARDVVSFATEVTTEGDNATCLVVRMGGWERRLEGGHGSLGTKESRDFKREEAAGPRNRRT